MIRGSFGSLQETRNYCIDFNRPVHFLCPQIGGDRRSI